MMGASSEGLCVDGKNESAMKKPKKRIGGYGNSGTHQQASKPRTIEMEPEELAGYMRRAEKQALPFIKETHMGPGAAQLLLALYTQGLVTGKSSMTEEHAMSMANLTLKLWQTGYYMPGPEYPYTLEETLQDLQNGLKAKGDYQAYFQSFTPTNRERPRGIGEVAGGIVQHPETKLWQIWMMIDGPCTFIAAYRDPAKAHSNLEIIISASRKGGSETKAAMLYQRVRSQADGEPKQLPYDMMLYLVEHLDSYRITL
jgi:hypothetical protein